MLTIIGLSGSLRAGSYNAALLRAAQAAAPEGVDLQIASIRDIPFYDGEVEAASGIPGPVAQLKDRIASADGLLLVTPEYNNSRFQAPSRTRSTGSRGRRRMYRACSATGPSR
jgi:NAD(P)H-dependent FMN reductase